MSEFDDALDSGSVGSDRIITEQAKSFLITSAQWATFLCVIGYIMVGFMVIGAFGILAMSGRIPAGPGLPFDFTTLGIIYLGLAVVGFFPILYLNRFAMKIKSGLNSSNTDEITSAFEMLKSHYKFVGILTIIIIILYIFAIVSAASAAF